LHRRDFKLTHYPGALYPGTGRQSRQRPPPPGIVLLQQAKADKGLATERRLGYSASLPRCGSAYVPAACLVSDAPAS